MTNTDADAYRGTEMLWSMPEFARVTMDRKQLRAFLHATGGNIMCQGHLRDIKTRHLGAGMYEVRTEARKYA